jgi:hypothetical protein
MILLHGPAIPPVEVPPFGGGYPGLDKTRYKIGTKTYFTILLIIYIGSFELAYFLFYWNK